MEANPIKIYDAELEWSSLSSKPARGVVNMRVAIGIDGMVKETLVMKSAPGLDTPALAVVRKWRYLPVDIAGKPTEAILTVTIGVY